MLSKTLNLKTQKLTHDGCRRSIREAVHGFYNELPVHEVVRVDKVYDVDGFQVEPSEIVQTLRAYASDYKVRFPDKRVSVSYRYRVLALMRVY